MLFSHYQNLSLFSLSVSVFVSCFFYLSALCSRFLFIYLYFSLSFPSFSSLSPYILNPCSPFSAFSALPQSSQPFQPYHQPFFNPFSPSTPSALPHSFHPFLLSPFLHPSISPPCIPSPHDSIPTAPFSPSTQPPPCHPEGIKNRYINKRLVTTPPF